MNLIVQKRTSSGKISLAEHQRAEFEPAKLVKNRVGFGLEIIMGMGLDYSRISNLESSLNWLKI